MLQVAFLTENKYARCLAMAGDGSRGSTVERKSENEMLRAKVRALEAELRARVHIEHQLLESSHALVCRVDGTGQITYASPASAIVLGVSARELMGQTFEELIATDDRDRVRREMAEAVGTADGFRTEYRLQHHSRGEPDVWIAASGRARTDVAGAVFAYDLTLQDITERKRARDRLRFTQFAVDHFSDAAYLVAQDARIVYVNDAASKMLGYTRAELLQMRIYDMNPDISADKWPAVWDALRKSGRRRFEGRHVAKDGTPVVVEISANYLQFDGGEYSCAFTRDITDRKQLETRLRQAEKMEAIGLLAGGIAHDFNNQLASIMGYADLVAEEVTDNAPAAVLVRNILLSVTRAADLTQKLLAFSRKGRVVSEPVDVHAIIAEVANLTAHRGGSHVNVEVQLNAEHSTVLGDASQLQSAVLNLALNARDALGRRGTICFATQNARLGEGFQSSHSFRVSSADYLQLTVTDDGCGMTEETLQRLFEPFFTTKDPGKGTGLGLAALYGTLKSHGGAANVESSVGEGTRFHIYLPITAGYARERDVGGPHQTSIVTGTRVLLVEDEGAVRDVGTRLLLSLDCSVTAVESGEKALELYRVDPSLFDVVILDMMMPGLNGRETFRRLRQLNPNVVALLASGYSLDGDAQGAIEEGVQDFIQKPYGRATLLSKLSAALNTRRASLGG